MLKYFKYATFLWVFKKKKINGGGKKNKGWGGDCQTTGNNLSIARFLIPTASSNTYRPYQQVLHRKQCFKNISRPAPLKKHFVEQCQIPREVRGQEHRGYANGEKKYMSLTPGQRGWQDK